MNFINEYTIPNLIDHIDMIYEDIEGNELGYEEQKRLVIKFIDSLIAKRFDEWASGNSNIKRRALNDRL